MPLVRLVSFCVLTKSPLCCVQEVSASCSAAFFPCSDKSLHLPPPVGRCPLLGLFFFGVLISSSFCRLQLVSALARFLPFHVLTSPIVCRHQRVSAPQSVVFFPCLDRSLPLLSTVGECPRSIGILRCQTKSLTLHSTEGEHPLLGRFHSLSRQVPPSTVFRK